MDNIIFRRMTISDVSSVHQLEVESFSTPWSKHALQSELKNKLAHYFVMQRGEDIIAYGGMWCMFDEAHITNIAVSPSCRQQGFGLLLMFHLMLEASHLKATRMTLEVRERNIAAQTLYEKCGFSKVGIRKGYYSDTKEDAYILWNDAVLDTITELKRLRGYSENTIITRLER